MQGPALRDEDYQKVSPYEKSHKPSGKTTDPRFGEVQIFSNPQMGEKILVRDRKYTDKTEAGRAIMSARNRLNNQNPYGLKLLDYSAIKQSELCSTIYILREFWEMPKGDLKRELGQRMSSKNYFSEAELSTIVYNIIKANANGTHGDINPLNIAYDRTDMNAKLIDRSDQPPGVQRTLNIQKAKVVGNQPLYQSPNMFSNLKRGNLKFPMDPSKEDAFALGLTALELGNLAPINNIYDQGRKEIDREALNRHLNEFRGRYNPGGFLVRTIEGFTNYDENQRLGLREVEASLPNINTFRSQLASNVIVGGAQPNILGDRTTVEFNRNSQMVMNTGPQFSQTETQYNATGPSQISRVETQYNTTAIPQQPAVSIYEASKSVSPFYQAPSVPPIEAQPIPQQNFTYTPPPPPPPQEPRSSIIVEKHEPHYDNTVVTHKEETYVNRPARSSFTNQQTPPPPINQGSNYNNQIYHADQVQSYQTIAPPLPQSTRIEGGVFVENKPVSSRTWIEYRPTNSYQSGYTTYPTTHEVIKSAGYISTSPYTTESVMPVISGGKITLPPEIRRSHAIEQAPSVVYAAPTSNVVYAAPATTSNVVYTTPTATTANVVYAAPTQNVVYSAPSQNVIYTAPQETYVSASPAVYSTIPSTTILTSDATPVYSTRKSYTYSTVPSSQTYVPVEAATNAIRKSYTYATPLTQTYTPVEAITSSIRKSYTPITTQTYTTGDVINPVIRKSYTTTPVTYTTGETYTSASPAYISTVPSTYTTTTPTAYYTTTPSSYVPVETVVSGRKSYTISSGAQTYVPVETVVTGRKSYTISSAATPTYVTTEGLTTSYASPSFVTTAVTPELTTSTVGGLKLVGSYTDPTFST